MKKSKNVNMTMGAMCPTTPFLNKTSASRLAMMTHHQNQAPTPKHPDIPTILTGFESQLKTFNVKMPCDGIIVSIHPRFYKGFGINSIKLNPYTLIIFQNQTNGEYDCLTIPVYDTRHLVYGVKLNHTPILNQLRAGMGIKKDTLFAYSNSVKEGNIFTNSISANVINVSHPCSIEDGYGISESFAKRGALLKLFSIQGSWGRKQYPLNLYGDDKIYKPFPNVGDKIKENGLIMAFREYSSDFDVIEMSNKRLRQVDYIHDNCIYGKPGYTVYDIDILTGKGETTHKPITPHAMCAQPDSYISQIELFYNSIIETYEHLCKNKQYPLLSPRLIQLLTRAYANKPNDPKYKNSAGGKVRRTLDKNFLDEYNIEIKLYAEQVLGLGSKITGKFGDKGVVCRKFKDEERPYDELGNRVDVIKYNKGSISRQNCGQLYEQYIGAAARDFGKWIRENYEKTDFSVIWEKILAFYKVAAPLQHQLCLDHYKDVISQKQHLQSIIESGIHLFIPPDSDHIGFELIDKIDEVFSPHYGKLSYKTDNGELVKGKDRVLIGVQDFIILEKTDLRPSSVSSSILQHQGLIGSSTKRLKNSKPTNVQTTRIYSETELRLYCAVMGSDTIKRLMLLANSPETHKNMIRYILENKTPTNMLPFDGYVNSSRPFKFVNHVLTCFGLTIKSENN